MTLPPFCLELDLLLLLYLIRKHKSRTSHNTAYVKWNIVLLKNAFRKEAKNETRTKGELR